MENTQEVMKTAFKKINDLDLPEHATFHELSPSLQCYEFKTQLDNGIYSLLFIKNDLANTSKVHIEVPACIDKEDITILEPDINWKKDIYSILLVPFDINLAINYIPKYDKNNNCIHFVEDPSFKNNSSLN